MAQNRDSKYSIEVQTSTGSTIADFSGRARDRKIHMARNDSHGAEWKLDHNTLEKYARDISVNAASLFSEGQNQALIKRLNVPLMSGQIQYGQGSLGETKEVNTRVVGWLDLFDKRQTAIEKIFVAGTDIGAAAWEAINDSQSLTNGSYGIIMGTLQDCPNLVVDALLEFKSIKELLQDLSSRVNGFDFEFTWDKRFNIYSPRSGVIREELEFIYPGNIKNIKPSRDSSTVINYAIVRGQGVGEGLMYTVSQDTDSMAAYGRRETVLDFADIPDEDTLQALGDEQIAKLKDPLEVVEITLDGNRKPFVGSYVLGDTIKVKIEDSVLYSYVTGYYRIDDITITIDDEDNEEVVLKLTK